MNIIIKVSTDGDVQQLAESIAQLVQSMTGGRCQVSVQDNRRMRRAAMANIEAQQKKLLNG